jgi:hypothetical protein
LAAAVGELAADGNAREAALEEVLDLGGELGDGEDLVGEDLVGEGLGAPG